METDRDFSHRIKKNIRTSAELSLLGCHVLEFIIALRNTERIMFSI